MKNTFFWEKRIQILPWPANSPANSTLHPLETSGEYLKLTSKRNTLTICKMRRIGAENFIRTTEHFDRLFFPTNFASALSHWNLKIAIILLLVCMSQALNDFTSAIEWKMKFVIHFIICISLYTIEYIFKYLMKRTDDILQLISWYQTIVFFIKWTWL